MKRVLLPIDGSDRSRRTVRMLRTLYRPEDVKVILATVVAREERLESEYIRKRWKDSAEEIFGQVLDQLAGYDVETVLLEGNPGAEIVRYAQEAGIDHDDPLQPGASAEAGLGGVLHRQAGPQPGPDHHARDEGGPDRAVVPGKPSLCPLHFRGESGIVYLPYS